MIVVRLAFRLGCESRNLLLSTRQQPPISAREKHFASLGGGLAGSGAPREAFCFSHAADHRLLTIERSILLLSAVDWPDPALREKHFASLTQPITAF
jgi:hypothetical protein